MNKNIFFGILLSSCAVHAGTMGAVSTYAPLRSFVSIEGGYSWNQIDGIRIDIADVGSIYTTQHDRGGSGRVAAGMINPVNDIFFLSTELGWGYYGNVKLKPMASGPLVNEPGFPNLSAISLKSTQDGFDILAGAIYNQSNYDLFVKAGALIQNSQSKLAVDFLSLSPDLTGAAEIRVNHTEVLPEIKLGGAYHLSENFSFLVSWTHAFGANDKIRLFINPNAPIGQVDINLQNTTLDVALLGLQYRLA